VPFALFDAALLAVMLAWLGLAWRDFRAAPSRARAVARVGARSLVWGAALYLLFLGAWGLNYRRLPLRERLPYDDKSVTAEAAFAAARTAVDRLNALHAVAHAAGFTAADSVDPALAAGFARAARDVRLSPSTVPARPKQTMLDWYFRRSGTDGMTDPYFLETLISSALLPFERPFVIAHEWAHLAGVGDEGDANFIGWLTCMRAGPAAQYSGTLFIYRELASAVAPRDRRLLGDSVGAGPREDLQAINRRYQRDVNPRLSAAGWFVYDSYLRANRVEAGAASYADVVKLVLGLRMPDMP
jgi:hypothetical protein